MKDSVRFSELEKAQKTLSHLRLDYWREEVLYSFQWWFLLISTFVIGYLWWKFVDRSRLRNIVLHGFLTLSIVIFLDVLGSELHLWDYPKMVLPWGSRIICIDIIISLVFMMLYQRFRVWKTYILISLLMALTFAFILEPLAIFMNIYKPYAWKSVYSFPIYFLLSVFIKWLVDTIHRIETREK
ncbi:hypothetical protein KGR20_21845 [Cytobacillus oceanisediminis]|uniref:Uncharacterized protein n=1 Tax=Niallia alba TaxID=2729105 RepID=A0A7Y0PKA2_9BACI|nr:MULTISPECIES: CBO0543 family protein [Bacillaceae]MBZ9536806.1 hypothetical protein [Cytobacillus oceanisediminis]NMO75722.1 hypothetical protein [Niallia alba]PGT81555.1 hypothetical protein COD11_17145 [Bacillus sp. AFS040349]UTI43519.1 hypothetical protein NKG37_07545 [Niallia sp. RD1]